MNRKAFALITVKAIDDGQRVIEGLASCPRPDRVGDVVEPLGASFKLPLPLLLDHHHDEQVGHVEMAMPSAAGIPFRARIRKIDEPGEVQLLCDKAWTLVKNKLRSAVSIGFRALDAEPIQSGGWRFKKWEWLELSLVSIPAQSDAIISTAKSLDDEAVMGALRAADLRVRRPCRVVRLSVAEAPWLKGSAQ
jgi:HK97 family phage prohead protease